MTNARDRDVAATVSHDRCVGVSMCTQIAPGAFKLTAAGQAEFDPRGDWTVDALHEAADSCPMSAISITKIGKG